MIVVPGYLQGLVFFEVTWIKTDHAKLKTQTETADKLRRMEMEIKQLRIKENSLMKELSGLKISQNELDKKQKGLLLRVEEVKNIQTDYRKELTLSRKEIAKLEIETTDCKERCTKLSSEFDAVKIENINFRYELLSEVRLKTNQIENIQQTNGNMQFEIKLLDESVNFIHENTTKLQHKVSELENLKVQLFNIKYENKELRSSVKTIEKVQTDINQLQNETAEIQENIKRSHAQMTGKNLL